MNKVRRVFVYCIALAILFLVIWTVFQLPSWILLTIIITTLLKEFLDEKFDFSKKVDKWTKKVIGLHISTILLLIYTIIIVVFWT